MFLNQQQHFTLHWFAMRFFLAHFLPSSLSLLKSNFLFPFFPNEYFSAFSLGGGLSFLSLFTHVLCRVKFFACIYVVSRMIFRTFHACT